jgi:Tfp pilus assembly protein PilF
VSVKPSLPRPDFQTRPQLPQPGGLPPATRPNFEVGANRPTTLPGAGSRPSLPNSDRPTTLPGIANRPNINDRPNINRPNDRPIIGGGNNNNVFIGGGNNLINNRPVTLPANRPDWGWGNNHDWHDHWQNNCINNHYHGWYHGCWNRGSYWYAPLAVGSAYWITSASTWGYGPTYYNPYYAAASSPDYNYSQPVVVNNYVESTAESNPTATATASTDPKSAANAEAAKLIDEALAFFKANDFKQATQKCNAALKKAPGDAVVHEVRALCLFAIADYQNSAAALNSLLAVAPGMDWTTMSTLYSSTDEYTKQLRALENHCKSQQTDAAAAFVLAYHYLVIDEPAHASRALRAVLKQQPKDAVAQRLLDSIPEDDKQPTPAAANDAVPPQTDLVGTWKAAAGDTAIELQLDEKAKFTWKAATAGKPAITVAGDFEVNSDSLVLKTKDQGNMAGTVKSGGENQFTFSLAGAPSTDSGLTFKRQR